MRLYIVEQLRLFTVGDSTSDHQPDDSYILFTGVLVPSYRKLLGR